MNKMDITDPITETKIAWFQNKMLEWAKDNLRSFPWRQTTDSYHIFVAEFLLQQTDAPRVVPVYQQLLTRYPKLESLAEASLSEVTAMLNPLGFHFRASRLLQASNLITKDPTYEGNIPSDEDKLIKLPGIGKYTARSICANAYSKPLAVLDTNISRILQCFFELQPSRARARNDPVLWDTAQRIAPSTNVSTWNLTLIDFGAALCTFRNPLCFKCLLRQQCNYTDKSNKDHEGELNNG